MQTMATPRFVVSAITLAFLFGACLAAPAPSDLIYRATFTYTLLNPTPANLANVSSNLVNSVLNSKAQPTAWAFGPDLGLQPSLGYAAKNADFGGWFDFATLDGVITFYLGLFNDTYYIANKPYLNGTLTTRIQTLHTAGSDIDLSKPQIAAIFAYQYNSTYDIGYTYGEVERVLANESQVSPANPNVTFLESDLALHDIMYPANPPNYNFYGKFSFTSQANLVTFYKWTVNQPDRNRVAAKASSAFRIQFQLNGLNKTLPSGVWGPKPTNSTRRHRKHA